MVVNDVAPPHATRTLQLNRRVDASALLCTIATTRKVVKNPQHQVGLSTEPFEVHARKSLDALSDRIAKRPKQHEKNTVESVEAPLMTTMRRSVLVSEA